MNKDAASFRDPSGFVFSEGGRVYRAVFNAYRENYRLLMESGLYAELVQKNYLVFHEECRTENFAFASGNNLFAVLCPEQIPLITYPYEWSFSQLKDAALLTLKIQRIALKYGMTLKDATAYNIQFLRGKPIFIDTLSFEKYEEGRPWIAYRQFCQHFLAPLLLMKYKDLRLASLLKNYIDGIPLDLANVLLPLKAKLTPKVFFHICMQNFFSKKYEKKDIDFKKQVFISKKKLLQMNTELQDAVNDLMYPHADTEWGEYYTFTNYNDKAFSRKKELIEIFLDEIRPSVLWDLGANNGFFTRAASEKGVLSYAFDIDPTACEKNYLQIKKQGEQNILPVLFDLVNPSPAIGFANRERKSLAERQKPDCVMALALIHHLAISNNLPLENIAEYFSSLAPHLIIEFVPKSDSQVQKLLATREDIFPYYTQEGFEQAFSNCYELVKKEPVTESSRVLYLFLRR